MGKDEPIGTVVICIDHQHICVPHNVTITIIGKISELDTKKLCMVELAAYNNMPSGVVVNCSCVTSKVRQVLTILINTSSRNIWIQQPLLATDVYEMKLHPWQ